MQEEADYPRREALSSVSARGQYVPKCRRHSESLDDLKLTQTPAIYITQGLFSMPLTLNTSASVQGLFKLRPGTQVGLSLCGGSHQGQGAAQQLGVDTTWQHSLLSSPH